MSNSKLDELKKHGKPILLAEIAAWLHDWQKCIDMAVASGWQKNPSISSEKLKEWRERSKVLKPGDFGQLLQSFHLKDDSEEIDIKTLCEIGRKPSKAEKHPNNLVRLLGHCHDLAHVEKELDDNEALDQACDRISQPFGFEGILPQELFRPLWDNVSPHLRKGSLPTREDFLQSLRQVFELAWGDTRRPINEVTLWDWASVVASLLKAEMARYLLTDEWRARNALRWHLLRVNFDVLGLYMLIVKTFDLLSENKNDPPYRFLFSGLFSNPQIDPFVA